MSWVANLGRGDTSPRSWWSNAAAAAAPISVSGRRTVVWAGGLEGPVQVVGHRAAVFQPRDPGPHVHERELPGQLPERLLAKEPHGDHGRDAVPKQLRDGGVRLGRLRAAREDRVIAAVAKA